MTLPESKGNSQLSRPQGMFPPTSLITSRPYTNDNHYLSLSKAWINKIVRILKSKGLIKALFAEWSRRCVRYLTAMAASRHQSAVMIRVFCLRAHSPTAAVDHLGEILTVFLNSNQHIDVLSDHPEYIDPSWFICIDGTRGHNTSLTSGFNSCAFIVYSAKGKQEVANKVDVMDELLGRLNLIGHEAFWACGADSDRRIVGDFAVQQRQLQELPPPPPPPPLLVTATMSINLTLLVFKMGLAKIRTP